MEIHHHHRVAFPVLILAIMAAGISDADEHQSQRVLATGADRAAAQAGVGNATEGACTAARLIQAELASGSANNEQIIQLAKRLSEFPTAVGPYTPSYTMGSAQAEHVLSPHQGSSVEYEAVATDAASEVTRFAIDQAHSDCFEEDPFPSATRCQQCHPGHYREWSVSPHAYAQISPIFNAMSNKLISLTNGTLGDFCIRCHTPVGMALKEPINISNMERHPTAREGVTCVVCHRINQSWGKGAGRLALVAGGLNQPVYGPLGNAILEDVLSNPEKFGVLNAGPAGSMERARPIHRESVPFFALSASSFCGACHDVFAPNGFRLEDAFSEFKASPAARVKGQSCQDCHMGKEPGVAAGFEFAAAAIVGNAHSSPRKRSNHMMIGPDYSIVHPGIFPHNPEAVKEVHPSARQDKLQGLATMREWLEFDHAAGWGTPAFELELSANQQQLFPAAWREPAKRYRARDILDDQFQLLNEASAARHQVLTAGYRLGQVELERADAKGIRFKIQVANGTDGHGVPTGFDAERLVFLRVNVCDSQGKIVFISGDLDPNGDIRDSHSFYVHNGLLPLDRQVFSLQTKFITRNIRGGEREQILNIAFSLDPLPYIRPETRPFTVLGRPFGARKQKQSLEVGGSRWAHYHIKPEQLTGCGPYYCRVQMIAGMVPVNLVQEIASVGFDYHLSAKEVAERVVNGHVILHDRAAVFHVKK